MNEELQSTNEELETSREELQSLNEELTTVNNQLEEKVDEVEASNNDLNNLLRSTNIATIFLDTDLCIRRFTPATRDLMRIIDSDVGRPIDDLAPRVKDPDLYEDAAQVLEKLQPLEAEVQNDNDQHFIRRIQPYRTNDNKIEGVVVTFTEVTGLRRAVDQTRKREKQQGAIADLGRIALGDEPLTRLFDRACLDLRDHLGVSLAKILELEPDGNQFKLVAGAGWQDGLVGSAVIEADNGSQAGYTLQRSAPVIVHDFGTEKRFKPPKILTDHNVVCGASVIIGPPGAPWGVLGAHEIEVGICDFDVDDVNFMQSVANTLWLAISARNVAQRVENERRELRELIDAVPFEFAVIGADQRYLLANTEHERRGQAPEDLEGKLLKDALGPELYKQAKPEIDAVLRGEPRQFELTRVLEDGTSHVYLASYTPRERAAGQRGFYAALVDITDRKREEDRLHLVSAELDHRVKNILATINSILRLAGRNAASLDAYRAELEDRIQSLARAHQMLAQSSWEGLWLSDLVHSELQPYTDPESEKVTIDGPDVLLVPSAAQSMALVVHELATNAAKYGALKGSDGTLSVTWRAAGDDTSALTFFWVEEGLEGVSEPAKKGFGSSVIDTVIKAQCDATPRVEYGSSGVRYELELPWACFGRNF